MRGKHDRTGKDGAVDLLATGPVMVRGVARGLKDGVGGGRASRHRAAKEVVEVGGTTRVAEAIGGVDPASNRVSPHPDADPDLHTGPDDGEEPDVAEKDGSGDGSSADRDPGPARADSTAGDRAADDDRSAPAEPATRVAETSRRPAAPSRFSDRVGREAVGVIVLVVLALVCAGLVTAVVVKSRQDAAAAAREAAAYTPPPLASVGPAAPGAPVIAVIGDGNVLQSGSGVAAARRWPQLLASSLEDDSPDAEVVSLANAGSGYIAEGTGGRSFAEAAADVPSSAAVVLFVGGAADDAESSLTLATAATRAFATAAERAPDAVVLAVGPLAASSDAASTAELRRTLRGAARIAGVRWVDPIAADWVSTGSTATALDADDQRAIENRFRTLVRADLD